jgi:hypothetical protein
MDDVKSLKTPPTFYSSMKSAAFGSSSSSRQARLILDKALDRMRELIESSSSRERMRIECEEFSQHFVEEVTSTKDLTDSE